MSVVGATVADADGTRGSMLRRVGAGGAAVGARADDPECAVVLPAADDREAAAPVASDVHKLGQQLIESCGYCAARVAGCTASRPCSARCAQIAASSA